MTVKHRAFKLGDLGLNLCSSPIHVEDGELSTAQNTVFSPIRAKRGIAKRPGMSAVNGTATASSVLGFVSIPLPDYSRPTSGGGGGSGVGGSLLLLVDNGMNKVGVESTDGAVWGGSPVNFLPQANATWGCHGLYHFNAFYYFGEDALANIGILRAYDGIADTQVLALTTTITVGGSPFTLNQVRDYDEDGTYIYVLCTYTDGAQTVFAVRRVAWATGVESAFGGTWGPEGSGADDETRVPWTLCCWNSKVWVGTTGNQSHSTPHYDADVLIADPAVGTWSVDKNLVGTGLTDYPGVPYLVQGETRFVVGVSPAGAGNTWLALLLTRDTAGTWTTRQTQASALTQERFVPLYADSYEMIWWHYPDQTSNNHHLEYSTDGGSTATSIQSETNSGEHVTRAVKVDSVIYGHKYNGAFRSGVFSVTAGVYAIAYMDASYYGVTGWFGSWGA